MLDLSFEDKEIFETNMNNGKDHLHLLKLQYLAAQITEHELQEKFDIISNQVLQDNIFLSSKEYDRININKGDRITDCNNIFCMTDEDMDKYFELCNVETFKHGLTTEDGTYCNGCNGMQIKLDAENTLIDYQISLLPKAMQKDFEAVKKNYTHRQKFLDIIMKGS